MPHRIMKDLLAGVEGKAPTTPTTTEVLHRSRGNCVLAAYSQPQLATSALRTVPLIFFRVPSSPRRPGPGGEPRNIHSTSTQSNDLPVSTADLSDDSTERPFASFRGRAGQADTLSTSSAATSHDIRNLIFRQRGNA